MECVYNCITTYFCSSLVFTKLYHFLQNTCCCKFAFEVKKWHFTPWRLLRHFHDILTAHTSRLLRQKRAALEEDFSWYLHWNAAPTVSCCVPHVSSPERYCLSVSVLPVQGHFKTIYFVLSNVLVGFSKAFKYFSCVHQRSFVSPYRFLLFIFKMSILFLHVNFTYLNVIFCYTTFSQPPSLLSLIP